MSVTLRILDANATLASHEVTLRQTEALSFRLLSMTTGHERSKPANLVTLLQDPSGLPPSPLRLEMVDGGLDQAAQEAQLNGGARVLVCYGSLYVQNQPRNIAAYR